MILVIPYRLSATDELRYSIRSMVKYFRDLTGVCLIGDCPGWFVGEHIPAVDIPGRKEWSIVSKILLAPYENFLLSSDDVYARQPFDNSTPCYYSGKLKDTNRHGKYADRIEHTRRLYPEGWFFDIHTPLVVNRDLYRDAHSIEWDKREYLNKSVYANFTSMTSGYMPDCKIRKGGVIPDLPFFSTNDRTALQVNFNELYPEKSAYEI